MLKSLSVRNYALIKKLDIEFECGFSVITGETGAGKSIILGALGLVLGQRIDSKIIAENEEKCVIEATFQVREYKLQSFFSEQDFDYDDITVIRREVHTNGKSRAFVNDTPVSLSSLKLLSEKLIDIHSQHQNLLLSDPAFQLQVIDAYAENQLLRKAYNQLYHAYKETEKKLADLIALFKKNQEEYDYQHYQLNQLEEAQLKEGEQLQLEEEFRILTNTEEIKNALSTSISMLENDELSVLSLLRTTVKNIQEAGKYIDLNSLEERLNSSYLELKDIQQELYALNDNLDFNPNRYAFLQERLNLIYELEHKHHVSTVEELIAIRDALREKLRLIDSSEERISALTKEVEIQQEKAFLAAQELSFSRKETAEKLEKKMVAALSLLGMPNVSFVAKIASGNRLDESGCDAVTFLFSANKNIELQPAASIASGGEISRIMLSIKSLLSDKQALPTIIFDEIDTGVSGEVADKMASIMKEMGKYMQVIAITHLPQIASKGNAHFKVYKNENGVTVETNIKLLSENERIEEIAQLLSGATVTEAAIQNARELLGS